MKKALLLLLLFPAFSFSQEYQLPTDSTGRMIYSDVVRVDSVNADELFARARQWFATAFVSAKDVIQNEDKQSHTITARPSMVVTWTAMGSASEMGVVSYTVKVFTKDERYRYEITDFYFRGQMSSGEFIEMHSPQNGFRKKDWERAREQVDSEAKLLIESLRNAMQVKQTGNNDW